MAKNTWPLKAIRCGVAPCDLLRMSCETLGNFLTTQNVFPNMGLGMSKFNACISYPSTFPPSDHKTTLPCLGYHSGSLIDSHTARMILYKHKLRNKGSRQSKLLPLSCQGPAFLHPTCASSLLLRSLPACSGCFCHNGSVSSFLPQGCSFFLEYLPLGRAGIFSSPGDQFENCQDLRKTYLRQVFLLLLPTQRAAYFCPTTSARRSFSTPCLS